jgi:uncharacterized Zn finger protein
MTEPRRGGPERRGGPGGELEPGGLERRGELEPGGEPEPSAGRSASDPAVQPWWRDAPTGGPLRVDGGIKARSTRGAIARTWWSARFIAVLESLGVGGRLGRGRAYARAGQVAEMRVTAGAVVASVQGSRAQPYKARIGLRTFGKAEWARVEQAMADSAWYAAKLLAGEMPPDIEDVFGGVGLALFPATAADLSLDCTCPDHEVPCKHLAAVCYLLAESFDADPFGMLALRGRDRETLLANVRARRTASPERSGPGSGGDAGPGPGVGGRGVGGRDVGGLDGGGADREPDGVPSGAEPGGGGSPGGHGGVVPALVDCLDDFYRPGGELPPTAVPSAPVDAVLDQLPAARLPGCDLVELLRPLYRALADDESPPGTS